MLMELSFLEILATSVCLQRYELEFVGQPSRIRPRFEASASFYGRKASCDGVPAGCDSHLPPLLGFSPFIIGLLFSVATATTAFHHISFGILSDRYGRKTFLLLGSIFATLRLVIFATTQDFWLLALGQGLGAMSEGAGAGEPVVSGYIADKTKTKERVSVFSTLAVTNSIAASIGSAIAGLSQFFQSISSLDLVSAHAPLFFIGAIFSTLSSLLLLPISDVRHEDRNVETGRKMLNAKSWSVIAKYSLARAAGGLSWGLIDSLVTLYFFFRFAVGSGVLGPIFAAARIISILTYPFIPIALEKTWRGRDADLVANSIRCYYCCLHFHGLVSCSSVSLCCP